VEDDVKQDVKVMKIYHWKKQGKLGKNGNVSLGRTILIKTFMLGTSHLLKKDSAP
jgi:hypothetical protein